MGWLSLSVGPFPKCAVAMQSKSGQDLRRYFPEIAAAAITLPERDYVLDGELVIPTAGGYSFDKLLQRIHPAESRIRRLAVETSALFVAFDLLRRNGSDLAVMKLNDRRGELEDFAKKVLRAQSNFSAVAGEHQTRKRAAVAHGGTRHRWRNGEAAGFALPKGQSRGNAEDKMHRTADCVIGGFRYGERLQLAGKDWSAPCF